MRLHLRSPSLSVEQAPVGLDLLLQACLDVQQAFVLGLLALRLTPNLAELLLQATDLGLDSRQLRPVASFGVSQAPFQRAFLRGRKKKNHVENKPMDDLEKYPILYE